MDRYIVINFFDRGQFFGVWDRQLQRTVFSRRVTEYDAAGRVRREAFHLNALDKGYVKEGAA
jgi:hypothetical protein